jgi:hypothetical protein
MQKPLSRPKHQLPRFPEIYERCELGEITQTTSAGVSR